MRPIPPCSRFSAARTAAAPHKTLTNTPYVLTRSTGDGGALALDVKTAWDRIEGGSLSLDYSLTRRSSIVTAFALSMHSHCITSGFPQGNPLHTPA